MGVLSIRVSKCPELVLCKSSSEFVVDDLEDFGSSSDLEDSRSCVFCVVTMVDASFRDCVLKVGVN